MTDPLTAAREALAAFDLHTRFIVAKRLSGKMKASPMNRRLPDAEKHLRAALARVDELEAMANGGYGALLADCDQTLSLALKAAEIGATPGPAWRESVRHILKVIEEVTR